MEQSIKKQDGEMEFWGREKLIVRSNNLCKILHPLNDTSNKVNVSYRSGKMYYFYRIKLRRVNVLIFLPPPETPVSTVHPG